MFYQRKRSGGGRHRRVGMAENAQPRSWWECSQRRGGEDGHAAQPRSTLALQLGQFCIALALWIAPGLLLMRSDLRTIVEALIANPLQYVPAITMVLAFALAYVVATGLSILATASRLTKRRPLHVKVYVLLVAAPAILLSLAFTLMSSLAFFLSLTIWCFPVLL